MINTKFSLTSVLEFIFFFCLNFSIALKFSQMGLAQQTVATALNIISLLALCLKYLFVSKVSRKAFCFIFFIVILGIIYSAYYLNMGILNIVMAILVAKGMSVKKIFKYNCLTMTLAVGFIAFTSIIWTTSIYAKDAFKLGEWKSLYAFGFVTSNTPSILMLTILTAYNLFRGNQLKNKEIVLEFLLTAITYFMFYARTGTFTFVIYLITLFICKNLKSRVITKFILWPCQYIYFFILGITFYAVANFDTSLYLSEINLLLSDRLHLWNTLVYYSGIHFLGNGGIIDNLGMSIDNAYIFLIIAYGICMLALYGFIFTYVAIKAYQKNDWNTLLVVLAYSLYGFGENQVFAATLCNVLLLFGCFFLNQRSDTEMHIVKGKEEAEELSSYENTD